MIHPHKRGRPEEVYLISSRIANLREWYGLSQAELARRAQLSVSAVNELENGVTRDPRISTVMAIARALHVPAHTLITGESSPAMYRTQRRKLA